MEFLEDEEQEEEVMRIRFWMMGSWGDPPILTP